MEEVKKCEVCKISFTRKDLSRFGLVMSNWNWERRRFCSRVCYSKGFVVWNKGKKTNIVPWNKGEKGSKYAMEHGYGKWMKDKFNPLNHGNGWRGEEAGYTSVHQWVTRWLGKPTRCEECGKDNLFGYMIHWANISKEYKREVDDWIRLCAKCHKQFDKDHKQLVFTR